MLHKGIYYSIINCNKMYEKMHDGLSWMVQTKNQQFKVNT